MLPPAAVELFKSLVSQLLRFMLYSGVWYACADLIVLCFVLAATKALSVLRGHWLCAVQHVPRERQAGGDGLHPAQKPLKSKFRGLSHSTNPYACGHD